MVRAKRTKTFTASTEAKVWEQLADWERTHPRATITAERPITAAGIAVSETKERSVITIYIEYEE
jgi:hypothetical protein